MNSKLFVFSASCEHDPEEMDVHIMARAESQEKAEVMIKENEYYNLRLLHSTNDFFVPKQQEFITPTFIAYPASELGFGVSLICALQGKYANNNDEQE